MRPSIKLPAGRTVLDVADASRVALEQFLALDPLDKLALSQWLIGPYRRATSDAPKRVHRAGSGEFQQVAQLASIVSNAQVILDQAIAAASTPGAEGLLALLPPTVDVVPVHDAYGARGFAPMDVTHAKLAVRLLSLLLADYLTRPDDYVAKTAPGNARRPSVRMLALG